MITVAVFAKNGTIGIYAVIDQVTFEPEGPSPNFIRISGVLVVPVPMSSGQYRSPQRGYFISGFGRQWNTKRERIGTNSRVSREQARWSDLPNTGCRIRSILTIGTVHWKSQCTQTTYATPPDVYPLPNKGDPDFNKIAAQLQKLLHR